MIEILNGLGLSVNESKVYLVVLKEGPLNLKGITEATGLYRANALDSIARLKAKGLLGVSASHKRNTYIAADPSRLTTLLESKQADLQTILPQLISMHSRTERPTIDILLGREGLSTILHDEQQVKSTINVLQSSETVEKKAGNYLEVSRARRAAAGIRMRIVYGKNDAAFARRVIKHPLTEARIADTVFKVTISVYGDRTALIFGADPTIIRIRDKDIAQRFMAFFEMEWKKADPI